MHTEHSTLDPEPIFSLKRLLVIRSNDCFVFEIRRSKSYNILRYEIHEIFLLPFSFQKDMACNSYHETHRKAMFFGEEGL